jgi:DNA-nicking Smr family endonuclease
MRTVDLHGLTYKDAVARFVAVYNHAVRHGQRERISVVHGYGASGKGGTLREKMRAFLERNGVDHLCGELVDGNPGHTIVIPGKAIGRG